MHLALVEILQADRDPVHEILATSRALRSTTTAAAEESTTAAAEELREQVVAVHAAGHTATAFETGLSVCVVSAQDGELAKVGENQRRPTAVACHHPTGFHTRSAKPGTFLCLRPCPDAPSMP